MSGVKRKLATVDLETGEVLNGMTVFFHKKSNPYPEGFIMLSQFAASYVAREKDFKLETHRVLWAMISHLSWANWTTVSQRELADQLGMKQPNVCKAMKLLETKGIILRGKRIGNVYRWRLNPEFGWKGDTDDLCDATEELDNSDFTEAKLRHMIDGGLGEHTGKLRIVNGGLNSERHKKKLNAQARKYRAWVKEYRRAIYGPEYDDGIDWEALSTEEVVELHDRAAEAEKNMKVSGEWEELMRRYPLK